MSLLSEGRSLTAYYLIEFDRNSGMKMLLDALDHGILKWTKEINTNFEQTTRGQMETYFLQLLLSVITKAWYFKRYNHPENAIEVLQGSFDLFSELKTSLHAEAHHVCARYALTLGIIYLEVGSYESALAIMLEGIKCLLEEQKIRYKTVNHLVEDRFPPKLCYRLRRNV